jgi:glycosyltransferase involved in cell wall biosynthesis
LSGLRVGVVPALHRSDGGVFQYSLLLVHALHALRGEGRIGQLELVVGDAADLPVELQRYELLVRRLPAPSARRLARSRLVRLMGVARLRALYGRVVRIRHRLTREPHFSVAPAAQEALEHLDLLFHPSPSPLAAAAVVPSVTACHDVQHRLQPNWEEISSGGEAAYRDALFAASARNAAAMLVDSETGREDVLRFYGAEIAADRVHVVPFAPLPTLPPTVDEAEIERARGTFGVRNPYVFYPAQFWPHKNHTRVVEALEVLRDRDVTVDAVFTGGGSTGLRARTAAEVQRQVAHAGLGAAVHFVGPVSDDDLAALYAGATALVMPTFFGPTNLPVLEAWQLRCPVITSAIRGITEHIGDAGLLVNPRDASTIADAIERLLREPQLRTTLVENGAERLADLGPDAFAARLAGVIAASARQSAL